MFEDVSIQDDESVVYKTEEFNVSSVDINAHYEYEFKTRKPKYNHEFYAVSAVLNVGWCPDPDSNSWLRDFDFLSDTTIYVPISDNTTDYEVDVPVVFHCKLTKFLLISFSSFPVVRFYIVYILIFSKTISMRKLQTIS